MAKKKTDEILGIFKEVTFFGFKLLPNGTIMPYSERISEDDKKRQNQFDMLQLQVKTGQLDSVSISGGYIFIPKNQTIPGELSRYMDSDGHIILQIKETNKIHEFNNGDSVIVEKIIGKTGKEFYQILSKEN